MPKERLSSEEYDFRGMRWVTGIRAISTSFKYLCKAAAIVLCFRYVYLGVVSLAGVNTHADLAIKILTDIKIDQWIGAAFGLAGVSYGGFQKKFRKNEVARLAKRNGELENIINPDRESSGLTELGFAEGGLNGF